jgi:hypothetical protein
LINDAQRKCLGCGKPISRVWFKGYCNVECVPDNVEIPRMILQSEAVRIDRAKCRVSLTEIEVRDLLAHLRSQAVGSDYDCPVGLVRQEHLNLARTIAGVPFAGAPVPFINLTPGDIIENLLVLLTEAENDYNNLVQGVHDMHDRRAEARRRQNLLQGGAR